MNLDAIEARAKAATPGPWVVDKGAFGIGVIAESQIGIPDNDPEGVYIADCYKKSAEVHAEFIAHAREDIPDLTARVRELESYIEERTQKVESLIKAARNATDRHKDGSLRVGDMLVLEALLNILEEPK